MKIHASSITLATVLAVLLLSFSPVCAAPDEYRAFWIDAWHAGALNQSQVDKLLGVVGDPNSKGDIRNANCNTVFVQVRRNADTLYPSGMGEPFMSGISPANFNGLQAVINAAHDTTGGKQRIDVHAWIVVFRTNGGAVYQAHHDPPTGSLTNYDNYWPTRTDTGAETDDEAFDPGHPLCEEYLVNVAMDIVNNFDVDGIHFDYIRFTGANQGYNPTSVARYNARYGLSGQPAANDPQWMQWRRDQVTAFVRKVYAKIQTFKPWVKQSGSFVTWNPSPTSSTRAAFQNTRPYYDVYSDWDAWVQEGIVDMAVPMTYYDWGGSYPNDYTRWMNFEKDRKGNRHMIIGPGLYLNSLSNSILELQMTRNPSPAGNYANGWSGYSYFAPYTNGGTNYGTWANFAPQLLANITQEPANIPVMPWKVSPTKGHISGTVYNGTAWVDGAQVSLTGPESRNQTADGTGFYAFIDLMPGTYSITVTSNFGTLNAGSITVTEGNMTVKDFNYISDLTGITGTVKDSMGNGVPGAAVATSTGGYSTITASDGSYTIAGMAPGIYTVTASRTSYTTQVKNGIVVNSGAATTVNFTINPDAPVITSVSASGIAQDSAIITWTTNVPCTSQVTYGQTRALGTYTASDPALVTTHSVTLTGLAPNRIYHYRAISANSLGQTTQSPVYTFFTAAPPSLTSIIVDNTDPGWEIISGTWNTGSSGSLFYGTNYRFADTTTGSASARCRWTPNIPASGNYGVYIYYPSSTYNRSSKAPFRIYYNGGNTTVNVDQRYNGGQWFLLGYYNFAAGSSGYVRLSNNTGESGKVVMADAVKFESSMPSDTTAPSVPTGLTASAISTTQIQLSWTASTDASGIGGYKIYRNGVLIDATTGATTYTDFGLSPNTSYTYTVSAYDIYANTSAQSGSITKATLCLPISAGSITCDKPASVWQTSAGFTFTNTIGFGAGKINHIRCVWDQNPSHTWTDTETMWTSGTKINNANPGGNNWYFHARAYNADNIPNGQVDLGPYYCDTTPPPAPVVSAARYTTSTNQLSCSWTGSDPESGIAEYEYAIGSTGAGYDVKGWTSNGTNTSVTASISPDLALDHTYYFSVRSKNNAGTTGNPGSSAGTTVARSCPSIAEARQYANGCAVQIPGRHVTYTSVLGTYVQDPERTAGIFLPDLTSIGVGSVITVEGILNTMGLTRALYQPNAVVTGGPVTLSPLGIPCTSLGGATLNQWTPGIDGGTGPYNIGLLVRTWGKVTTSTPGYFYITDGVKEIKVISIANPGASGPCYAVVTGISSWETSGDKTVPVVLASETVERIPL